MEGASVQHETLSSELLFFWKPSPVWDIWRLQNRFAVGPTQHDVDSLRMRAHNLPVFLGM